MLNGHVRSDYVPHARVQQHGELRVHHRVVAARDLHHANRRAQLPLELELEDVLGASFDTGALDEAGLIRSPRRRRVGGSGRGAGG